MHRTLNRSRDERGAIAVIVGILATVLLVIAALVVDIGIVRVDRQIDKSGADAATLAGLHGLNGGDASPRPFVGVCTAIRYLQTNNTRFSGMTVTSGSWTDGNNAVIGVVDPCADPTYLARTCASGDLSTWAKFTWSTTLKGEPFNVIVQSGYLTSTSSGYSEDALPAASAENDDSAGGCNQLAVLINQERQPGLGTLATEDNVKTSVRSVGRVRADTGGYAPAMLLLERDTCPVLESGSNSGGSFIHVLGAVSTDGKTQPGTIHSDSSAGSSCSGGSNQNLFLGKGSDGIVAYAAPLAGNPSSADTSKPGQITSYAGSLGKALNFIIDNNATLTSAYAASGINAAAPGTHLGPTGLGRVGRTPVDQRYFTGVKGAIAAANSVFNNITAATAPNVITGCTPTQAAVDALNLTPASTVYVNCAGAFAGPNADLTIPAGTLVFRGTLAPNKIHTYPNATKVYVNGLAGGDAISIGNGSGLKLHTGLNLDGSGRCVTSNSNGKALLVVKSGRFRESNGGQLQLCNTTAILMGDRADGCVPGSAGAFPTLTPCGGGLGDGHLLQQGGDIDWTAPDLIDVTLGSDNLPTAAALAGWQSIDGPEDLALWTESASGGTANNIYRMQGGGVFKVRGVFMVPNAVPFTIGGSASLDLRNAQFVARTIALNGTNTNITMSVDGNSAVTLPKLAIVGLVR